MCELKKNGNVFTSKFVGPGPSSYKKRIYRVAVSQRVRNTAVWHALFYDFILIAFKICIWPDDGHIGPKQLSSKQIKHHHIIVMLDGITQYLYPINLLINTSSVRSTTSLNTQHTWHITISNNSTYKPQHCTLFHINYFLTFSTHEILDAAVTHNPLHTNPGSSVQWWTTVLWRFVDRQHAHLDSCPLCGSVSTAQHLHHKVFRWQITTTRSLCWLSCDKTFSAHIFIWYNLLYLPHVWKIEWKDNKAVNTSEHQVFSNDFLIKILWFSNFSNKNQ
jgi:hypothetical protein